jgi:hypothetical protein
MPAPLTVIEQISFLMFARAARAAGHLERAIEISGPIAVRYPAACAAQIVAAALAAARGGRLAERSVLRRWIGTEQQPVSTTGEAVACGALASASMGDGEETARWLHRIAADGGMNPVAVQTACRERIPEDGRVDRVSVQRMIDWAVGNGFAQAPLDAVQLIDTRFLDRAEDVGRPEDYVLKPLYSFAGAGVIVGPTAAQLAAASQALALEFPWLRVIAIAADFRSPDLADMAPLGDGRRVLRDQDDARKRQINELAEMTAENHRLANLVARSKSDRPLSDNRLTELLRLRGAVGRLRRNVQEMALAKNAPPLSVEDQLESMKQGYLAQVERLKQWLETNWIALSKMLGRDLKLILPCGSDPERTRSERIAAEVPGASVLYRSPLDQVAKLIAGAQYVVGVDTGLLHLAAALGVPLVAIFTGSKPSLTGPVGNGPIAVLGANGAPPSIGSVADAVAKIIR